MEKRDVPLCGGYELVRPVLLITAVLSVSISNKLCANRTIANATEPWMVSKDG
jgi:hypothetical protein